MSFDKNVAFPNYRMFMRDPDNPHYGLNGLASAIDVNIAMDTGNFATATNTNSITPITGGPDGWYRMDVTQPERNGDIWTLTAESPTALPWQDTQKLSTAALTAQQIRNAMGLSYTGGAPTDTSLDGMVIDILALLDNRLVINKATSELWLYDAAGTVVIKTWPLTNKDGGTVVLQGTGPANRGVQLL